MIAMDLQDEEEDVVEVNAIHTERGEPDAVPITLDSGADISVLPREFADRGVWSRGTTSLKMIDAQGREIKHDGVTKARVQVWSKDGKLIEIVEDFVLGNVKHPILCAGRMMKRGWDIKREEGEPCLVHDMTTSVPLRMERNSLLFDAKIFTVEAELNEKPLEVNVLRGYLSKYLKDLEMSPGWHRLPNGVAVFSDPVASILLDPRQSIESDMRGRLTMLKEKDGTWRQVENVEDYLQLGNMAFRRLSADNEPQRTLTFLAQGRFKDYWGVSSGPQRAAAGPQPRHPAHRCTASGGRCQRAPSFLGGPSCCQCHTRQPRHLLRPAASAGRSRARRVHAAGDPAQTPGYLPRVCRGHPLPLASARFRGRWSLGARDGGVPYCLGHRQGPRQPALAAAHSGPGLPTPLGGDAALAAGMPSARPEPRPFASPAEKGVEKKMVHTLNSMM